MKYTHDPRVDTGADYYLGSHDSASSVHPGIVGFIAKRAGKRILDVGCGTGGYSRRLMDLGFDVTAVDRNEEYIKKARSLGVNAQVIVDERFPFPDDSFDSACMIEVLEHLPDSVIPNVLAEVKRVVKKNLLLTVPCNHGHDELFTAGFLHNHFVALDHVQFFTRENLNPLLKLYFGEVSISEDDPVWPHRLLPAGLRRPISMLYRLRVIRPTIFSRLYAEARIGD